MIRLRYVPRVNLVLVFLILLGVGCGEPEQPSPIPPSSDGDTVSDFKSSLNLKIDDANAQTGMVKLNGVDSRQPKTLFSIDWGDGQITEGGFPQSHQYQNTEQHHVIKVTAFYSTGESDSKTIVVQFASQEVSDNVLPHKPQVTSPSEIPTLTRLRTPLKFNYRKIISDFKPTLTVNIVHVNSKPGTVKVNGGDTRQPKTPFSIDWGDGQITQGGYPQSHRYQSTHQNYVVTVTAYYSTGESDSKQALVQFAPSKVSPKALSPKTRVTIPTEMPPMGICLYIPPELETFDATFFDKTSRSTVEYVLSVAAQVQLELVNEDVLLTDGAFQQNILLAPGNSGAFSLWYTKPPSLGAGDWVFKDNIQYSSLFHEMGHNFTLNTPAKYIYGGKSDGNANAIYSETMAQIMAHVTAAELVNRSGEFGIPDDIALEIAQNSEKSMKLLKSSYNNYREAGMPFTSWNSPETKVDETFNTFMTVAYKFFELAERNQSGYTVPLQRMMALLQTFDEDAHMRFGQHENTPEAEAFRSTLMVTALSYAFDQDLREEFSALNFPINNSQYGRLMAKRKIAAQNK